MVMVVVLFVTERSDLLHVIILLQTKWSIFQGNNLCNGGTRAYEVMQSGIGSP